MTLTAAYGGARWSQRSTTLANEFGSVWGPWGVGSEIGTLRAVLMRRPGAELDGIEDFEALQMRADLFPDVARSQHDSLADAYRAHGVEVHYVGRTDPSKPNAMFIRDLMLMTPEGAILARPASTVRAGEERWVAATLAELGVPILMSVRGEGTFEGADCCWIDDDLCFLAEGLRTNRAGADQVEWMLRSIGVQEVVRVGLTYGAMHLDGCLSILDRDLAVVWPHRTPVAVVQALRARGFRLIDVADADEANAELPLNGVALSPGKILMPAGGSRHRALLEDAGVECIPVEIGELIKAGGGIHCMTAFLKRDSL